MHPGVQFRCHCCVTLVHENQLPVALWRHVLGSNLLFLFLKPENWCPGDRGILRTYLGNLQELRVGLHPVLPVQRLRLFRTASPHGNPAGSAGLRYRVLPRPIPCRLDQIALTPTSPPPPPPHAPDPWPQHSPRSNPDVMQLQHCVCVVRMFNRTGWNVFNVLGSVIPTVLTCCNLYKPDFLSKGLCMGGETGGVARTEGRSYKLNIPGYLWVYVFLPCT